ncbi:hypothetical protein [Blastococcus brunescens]|uniref:Lipoprotein n=1 Tax=Blastococcus brunescens TaxID=1564165 RepID=A0ABZ1B399_9ACTN|nr:hypothetical protein [Blastococcus sp. BMG 8361]WRL65219.1 hypothetical protein U6N30_06010 [Blastococcus sp. BMG 8361]
MSATADGGIIKWDGIPHCAIIGVSIAAGMTACTRHGNGRSEPSG